jgi:hypothetical protein
MDLVLEIALLRLVWHVHTAASHIVFPAVIDATKPIGFVAPKVKRSATMGTVVGEHPHPSTPVSIGDEIFA